MEKIGADNSSLLNGLAQITAEISKYIKELQAPIYDLRKTEVIKQELVKRMLPLQSVVNKIITTFKTTAELQKQLIILADAFDKNNELEKADKIDNIIKNENIYEELVKFADELDKEKKYKFADKIDEIIKCAFIPRFKKELEERAALPIQDPAEGTLSTRYCPDHTGTQSIRVAEHLYQCPLDGKIYNYLSGYTNYKGQQVLGGSVKEQTPANSNFGGVPMMIYDPRANIINKSY